MARTVATTDDLPPGERLFVDIDGVELAVLNVDGEYYAIRNVCPHMEGPVGRGPVGVDREGTPTIQCPFHNWQFDLDAGRASFGRSKQLVTYDVRVEKGDLVVEI